MWQKPGPSACNAQLIRYSPSSQLCSSSLLLHISVLLLLSLPPTLSDLEPVERYDSKGCFYCFLFIEMRGMSCSLQQCPPMFRCKKYAVSVRPSRTARFSRAEHDTWILTSPRSRILSASIRATRICLGTLPAPIMAFFYWEESRNPKILHEVL